MSIVSSEIDFQPKEWKGGHYNLHRIIQQNGQTDAIALSNNSVVQSRFEIQDDAVNLARSHLSFQVQVTHTDTRQAVLFRYGFPMIDSIRLTDRGGQDLVFLPRVGQYSRMVLQAYTKKSEFLGLPVGDVKGAPTSYSQLFNPSNALNNATLGGTTGANGGRVGNFIPHGATVATNTNASSAPSQQLNGTEYIFAGAKGEDLKYNVVIPLSMFKGTMLSMDKSIRFGQVMTLEVNFAPKTRLGFQCSTVGSIDGDVADIAGAGQINNLYFYVAREQDLAVQADLQSALNQGHTMTVPSVYQEQKVFSDTGTSRNFQINVNRQLGSRLLRVMWQATHGLNTSKLQFNASNHGGAKVSSYWTTWDGVRLQEYDLKVSDNSDYLWHKDTFEKSVYDGDIDEYRINPVHCDNWSKSKKSVDWAQSDFQNDGMPLLRDSMYGVSATTGAVQLIFEVLVISQKQLTVSNQGITLV